MLSNWAIENFKSVGRKLSLDLAPITLFVGANSSGKSTIIQSMLLIKQTLQYAPTDRPIALNGPLLKLGNFNDIKNAKSKENNFSLSFSINHSDNDRTPLFGEGSAPSVVAYVGPYGQRFTRLTCSLQFDLQDANNADELTLLQPSLLSSSIDVHATQDSVANGKVSVSVRRAKKAAYEKPKDQSSSRQEGRFSSPSSYDVRHIDPGTKEDIIESRPEGEIIGASLRHFLPFSIAVKFDEAKRRAREVADILCERRPPYRAGSDILEVMLPKDVSDEIDKWLLENSATAFGPRLPFDNRVVGTSPNTVKDTFEKIRLARRRRPTKADTPASASLQALHPIIEEQLLNHFERKTSVEMSRSPILIDAATYMRDYFYASVRYLGPLRDEPKPLYPLEALANPTDVGYRGEHTAAVLDLHKDRQVTYIPSAIFDNDSLVFKPVSSTLHDAVVDWLSYMGVVNEISTGDKGKFGHELQVRTPGIAKYHDLTNVGVGVSQVLPIVVMALLAPQGSLLIFEQPELHLHPKVQTRLGDFFISIAKHGKQCILETHSEYLIYRLRRRVAESETDELTKLGKLYFVERDEGETKVRPVEITKYGAIVDWPEDFFDQSQDEAERILMAAAAKRTREKNQRQGH
ncbi:MULTISPECIES: DUF3696 domain-containing protein [unclassified Azospirillum]|uniref:AAA family ATPase n=1 Tax=unclassified Azospirillum TaxID=2630922 RepID=UPI000D6463E6|nr:MULTISPECIES: DUF3696 domain-containing protein [unclassified Azospirillum]